MWFPFLVDLRFLHGAGTCYAAAKAIRIAAIEIQHRPAGHRDIAGAQSARGIGAAERTDVQRGGTRRGGAQIGRRKTVDRSQCERARTGKRKRFAATNTRR